MKTSTDIELLKFLSNSKIYAQKDAENNSLSKNNLNISLNYYNEIISTYTSIHKQNTFIMAEIEELQKAVIKLKNKLKT